MLALLARRKFRRIALETLVVAAVCVALGWAMTRL
jgi:hypothetical protein